MPFRFLPVDVIPGLSVIEPRTFTDERGAFTETYKHSDFAAHGIPPFVQDNRSVSRGVGVLRGLHYQAPPHAQGKLVRCAEGRVFDVAVDIRRGSPTFGKWHGMELDDQTQRMFWIPAGFAHGFCSLSARSVVMYKVTAEYEPTAERCLRWDDPDIDVEWPVEHPLLAARDAAAPSLASEPSPFRFPEDG